MAGARVRPQRQPPDDQIARRDSVAPTLIHMPEEAERVAHELVAVRAASERLKPRDERAV